MLVLLNIFCLPYLRILQTVEGEEEAGSDQVSLSDQVMAAEVDEIFASSGPATHSAAPGGSTSQTTLKKDTQQEQHSIGGAIKGFFRKVFSGKSLNKLLYAFDSEQNY